MEQGAGWWGGCSGRVSGCDRGSGVWAQPCPFTVWLFSWHVDSHRFTAATATAADPAAPSSSSSSSSSGCLLPRLVLKGPARCTCVTCRARFHGDMSFLHNPSACRLYLLYRLLLLQLSSARTSGFHLSVACCTCYARSAPSRACPRRILMPQLIGLNRRPFRCCRQPAKPSTFKFGPLSPLSCPCTRGGVVMCQARGFGRYRRDSVPCARDVALPQQAVCRIARS